MVEKKSKRILYFIVFILPCFILYNIFCVVPFVRGIDISMTQWDGLTPKTPIIMEKVEFESLILNKLKKQSDRDYILEVYQYETEDNAYHRRSVGGLKRIKLQRIIKKTKYEPEYNKFIGFENYRKIFMGKVGDDFYPHTQMLSKYTKTSSLKTSISVREFEKEVLKGKNPEDERVVRVKSAYAYSELNNSYVLQNGYRQSKLEDCLWNIDEYLSGRVSDTKMDNFIRMINSSIANDEVVSSDIVSSFIEENTISKKSALEINDTIEKLVEIGKVKKALSELWVVRNFNLGVVGFTLFFAFFSVIGINVLAFALALALDVGLKGQKLFRTIFFLPNVLSMIIVALIWSMLFNQLLPSITGITEWLSDSKKTPWLLVSVAVWQGAGYYMIVYLAGLQNIPTDVIEAAKIDGATGWQRFCTITLPLMIPSLTISMFLSIANALKSFDLIYAMIGPTGYATGTVPFVMDIYFDAFSKKLAGLATAKAMVLFLAIVLVTGVQLFIMKRREVEA